MNVWWIIVLPLALSGFALGLIYDDGVRGTRDGQLAATVAIESVGVTPKQQRRSGETRLNPVQRITLACEQPGRVQRMHDLDEILQSLTLQELRDAAPGVLAIRESRRDALIALFSRWVELDPADAAEFAVTRASYAAWGTDYFLTIWSKVDMDAALRWYCARRPPVHEEQVLPLQVFRENGRNQRAPLSGFLDCRMISREASHGCSPNRPNIGQRRILLLRWKESRVSKIQFIAHRQ
jgi:hypothetical protein